MFSGDLRRILLAKKLIDNNLDLTELGRLLESCRQQNIRVSVTQDQTRTFLCQLAHSIDEIKDEQYELELCLEERLIEREKFDKHRSQIHQRLSELKLEREEEIQKMSEYLQGLEVKLKAQQEKEDARNAKLLEEKRDKVRRFQEQREEKEKLAEIHVRLNIQQPGIDIFIARCNRVPEKN